MAHWALYITSTWRPSVRCRNNKCCVVFSVFTVWRASSSGWHWISLRGWGTDCSTGRCRRRRHRSRGCSRRRFPWWLKPQTQHKFIQFNTVWYFSVYTPGPGVFCRFAHHLWRWREVQWLVGWRAAIQQTESRSRPRCSAQRWSSERLWRWNDGDVRSISY